MRVKLCQAFVKFHKVFRAFNMELATALKNIESFVEFKSLIKNWKPSNCPCRLCKDYIPQVGFVNLIQ